MKPTFFATGAALRAWLEKHHATKPESHLGLYKKASGKPSITWSQAVDEALCFGWIDGRGSRKRLARVFDDASVIVMNRALAMRMLMFSTRTSGICVHA